RSPSTSSTPTAVRRARSPTRCARWWRMADMSEVTRLSVRGAAAGPEPAEGYDVVVGHGVLGEVPAVLGSAPQRVAVAFAAPLAGLAARVIAELDGYDVLRLELPDGEVAKTGQVAIEAWE